MPALTQGEAAGQGGLAEAPQPRRQEHLEIPAFQRRQPGQQDQQGLLVADGTHREGAVVTLHRLQGHKRGSVQLQSCGEGWIHPRPPRAGSRDLAYTPVHPESWRLPCTQNLETPDIKGLGDPHGLKILETLVHQVCQRPLGTNTFGNPVHEEF